MEASRATRTHTRASPSPGTGRRPRTRGFRPRGGEGKGGVTSFRVTCPATLSPAYDSDFLSDRYLVTAAGDDLPILSFRETGVFDSPFSTRGAEKKKEDARQSSPPRLPLSLSPSPVHHHLLHLLSASPSSTPSPSPLLRQTAEREAPREHRTRDWRVFLPARELFTVHCLGNASRISRAEPR